jgi:hypothetical protein
MTTYAPPPLWSSGVEWSGSSATWLGTLPSSGRPNLYVSIAGELSTVAMSGSWRLGRSDWFDVLSPNTGSFSMKGTVTANVNDEIVVSTDSGVLWVGYVDDVSTTKDLTGTWTTVNATDVIGRMGLTIKPPGRVTVGPDTYLIFYLAGGTGVPGGTLDEVFRDYLALAGFDIDVTVGDSAGTLPTHIDWYDASPVTLLELLNLCEKSANAMAALQRDGSIVVVMRDALVAGSVAMTSLTGLSTPFTWSVTASRSSIINHLVFERPAYDDTTVLDATNATSLALYGDRTYSITDYVCSSASHFSTALRTAIASPRSQVTGADIHISDLSQGALLLAPLSWVQYDGDVWQVMSIEHRVTPSEWTVSLTADASQNAITGNAEPTPA